MKKPIKNILFVGSNEDEYIILSRCFQEIRSYEFHCDWQPKVEDALEYLAVNQYDFFLLDYELNGLNGLELFKKARSLGNENPVILLMRRQNDLVEKECLSIGFADYMIKSEINSLSLERGIRYAEERQKNIEKVRSSEREIDHARKLAEESSKMKSDFIMTITEELKIPLTSVREIADFFKSLTVNDEQKNYFNALENAQQELSNIVGNLADFSDIEADIFNVNFDNFSLPQLINEINLHYYPKAKGKGLLFDSEISENIEEMIYGDYNKLNQLLRHILDNALKFTLKGEIHLDVEIFSKERETILFSVSDTGIGISKDKMKSIFNSFEQGQKQTDKKIVGTGLGLTISKKIVELMNGKIWLESTEGQGSCFYFTIPIKFHMSTDHKTNAKEPLQLMNDKTVKRILLVDDTEDMRNLVEIYLSLLSYQVVPVTDGAEAIEKFKSEKFDVVIMDMRMPVMDGIEATGIIRAWENEKGLEETPIIAMTAYSMDDEIEATYKAGCNYHIAKPITRESLLEILNKALKDEGEEKMDDDVIEVEVDQDLEELIPGYLEKRVKDVEQLRGWVDDENYSEIQELSHKIKGSGGGYGFQHLSEYASLMEQASKEKDLSVIKENIEKIDDYVKRVRVKFVEVD